MITLNKLIKGEIYENQSKRIENGSVVIYKDKEEHFQSPGFTTVKVSALKGYVKSLGFKDLEKALA